MRICWDKIFFMSCQCVKTFLLLLVKHNRAMVNYHSSHTKHFAVTVLCMCHSLSLKCIRRCWRKQLSSAPFPLKAGSHYSCRTALLRNILDLPWAWWKVSRLVGPFTFALSIRQTERRRHKDPQQRERASLASDWQWLCLMYYPRIDRHKSAEVAGGGLHTTAQSRKRDRRICSSNTNLSTVKK